MVRTIGEECSQKHDSNPGYCHFLSMDETRWIGRTAKVWDLASLATLRNAGLLCPHICMI
jgi:hypothetical protein